MVKDFKSWLKLKSNLDSGINRPGYKSREIWWIHIGLNIGFEENGKGVGYLRPVLILTVFSKELFWGIPLTSKHKIGKYYLPIQFGNNRQSTLLLTHLRSYDSKRLVRKLGELDKSTFELTKRKIIDLI